MSSHAEFGARVNTLARELISFGVGPDVAVGVCIDRGVEMVVAIHAIVAAGGQYVPFGTDTWKPCAVHGRHRRCGSGPGHRRVRSRGFEGFVPRTSTGEVVADRFAG